MTTREFTIPSTDGRTTLHAVEWLPEGKPKAVLQISHGVSEYILRYAPLAEHLTQQGFAVVGSDHLGHGGSVSEGGARMYFGPKGSWKFVVDDLYTLRCLTGRRFPDLPYFLLGHSMGSFLARTYLICYPGTVAGAILMGTGQMAPTLVAAGRILAAGQARKVGETQSSPVVLQLAFGTYNKGFAPNRTGVDWLSANEENVDAYIADPLCGEDPSTGLFREMLGGIAFISKGENLRKMNANTPILFLSGAMDPVGDCGKGVQKAEAAFRKAGMRDVGLKLYPGLRHEILQEHCKTVIYDDIAQWLDEKI